MAMPGSLMKRNTPGRREGVTTHKVPAIEKRSSRPGISKPGVQTPTSTRRPQQPITHRASALRAPNTNALEPQAVRRAFSGRNERHPAVWVLAGMGLLLLAAVVLLHIICLGTQGVDSLRYGATPTEQMDVIAGKTHTHIIAINNRGDFSVIVMDNTSVHRYSGATLSPQIFGNPEHVIPSLSTDGQGHIEVTLTGDPNIFALCQRPQAKYIVDPVSKTLKPVL